MITQPFHVCTIPLHSPPIASVDEITADIITTSRGLWGCIEEMRKTTMLEEMCNTIFQQCVVEKSSVLTTPITYTPEDTATKEAGEDVVIAALVTLSTCSGLVRFHLSAWDDVYERNAYGEDVHYHSFTLALKKRIVTLVTFSERIAKNIALLHDQGLITKWTASLYPDILRPMTVLINHSCIPETPVVITRGDRTEPQCDILHLAIEDALPLAS